MARARALPISNGNPSADAFVKLTLKDAYEATRKEINANPFFSGVSLPDLVALPGTTITVVHGLGYTPSGYIVTKLIGTSYPQWAGANATTIQFQNAGASSVTFTAWVF